MEKLRPNNNNGDAIALAVIALVVAVLVTWFRLEESWASTVNFIYTAAAAALVLGLAYLSPAGGRPAPYQTVLYVAGLGLTAIALLNLKDVFGDLTFVAGTRVWILLVLVAIAGYLSWFRASGVMTLFAGLLKIGLVLSLVEWLFDPKNVVETDRWFLAVMAFAYIAVVVLFEIVPEKFRQVAVVDAAGFALLALSITFLGDLFGGFGFGDEIGTSVGWEIIIGLGSLLLIGYAMLAGDPGPGYLGGFNLVAFSIIAAVVDDPSFVWWPLVLLIITIAAFAAAFSGQKIPKLSDVPSLQVSAATKAPAKKSPAKKSAAKKRAAKK